MACPSRPDRSRPPATNSKPHRLNPTSDRRTRAQGTSTYATRLGTQGRHPGRLAPTANHSDRARQCAETSLVSRETQYATPAALTHDPSPTYLQSRHVTDTIHDLGTADPRSPPQTSALVHPGSAPIGPAKLRLDLGRGPCGRSPIQVSASPTDYRTHAAVFTELPGPSVQAMPLSRPGHHVSNGVAPGVQANGVGGGTRLRGAAGGTEAGRAGLRRQ